MKLKGNALSIREYTNVTIPRYSGDITLKVAAIPMGLQRLYEQINPKPLPPITVTQRMGKPAEKEPDFDNPEYVRAFTEWSFLKNIYVFYYILKVDESVSFDNEPKDLASLRKLEEEIRNAGISDGDMALIMQKSAEAANLSPRDVEEAKAGLS